MDGSESDLRDDDLSDAQRPPLTGTTPYKECGAKKRNGEPCRAFAMANGRCRIHGGASFSGPKNPAWKHGKRSAWYKQLKGDLRAGFLAAAQDAELAGLRDVLLLQRGFVSDLLKRLGNAEHVPAWTDLVLKFRTWKALPPGDAATALLGQIEQLLTAGAAAAKQERALRLEIREVLQEITKTSAAEWKRITDLRAVLTAEQAVAFGHALIEAADETVPDREMRAALYGRVRVLMSGIKMVTARSEENAPTSAETNGAGRDS